METIKYNGMELEEFKSDKPVIFDSPRAALCWMNNGWQGGVCEYILAFIPRSDSCLVVTDHSTWLHCALLPEKPVPRKVTNLELAEWLARGNGQVQYKVPGDSDLEGYRVVTSSTWTYKGDDNWALDYENFYGDVWVRRWGDNEWHVPTTEYLDLEDV